MSSLKRENTTYRDLISRPQGCKYYWNVCYTSAWTHTHTHTHTSQRPRPSLHKAVTHNSISLAAGRPAAVSPSDATHVTPMTPRWHPNATAWHDARDSSAFTPREHVGGEAAVQLTDRLLWLHFHTLSFLWRLWCNSNGLSQRWEISLSLSLSLYIYIYIYICRHINQ